MREVLKDILIFEGIILGKLHESPAGHIILCTCSLIHKMNGIDFEISIFISPRLLYTIYIVILYYMLMF